MTKPIPHYFRAGYIAGKSGVAGTANPMLYKGWPWHAWRLGQEYGELEARVNAGELGSDEEHLERAEKCPRDQSQAAHAKGLTIDDCPYDPETQDWRNWRLGWIAAFNDYGEPDYGEGSGRLLIWAVVAYLALAILAGFALWAFLSAHPSRHHPPSKLVECQRRVPPWQTGECR